MKRLLIAVVLTGLFYACRRWRCDDFEVPAR